MAGPTNHKLSERIAVLEEKMNTSYERLRADIAQRDIEAGKRENRLLLAIIIVVGVATAILGVLITAQ